MKSSFTRTLIRPQYLLRAGLVPSIPTRSSLILRRKRHSKSYLQKSFEKHTGPSQLRVIPAWEEFYTRARALRNNDPRRGDLEERANEESIDFSKEGYATLNAADKIAQKIEQVVPYNFPKDCDEALDAACNALSDALQNASMDKVEHDTTEVEQALDNLQKVYNEAAKSNTVLMRYIDIEPPYAPSSPLSHLQPLEQIVLARSWVKELIAKLRDQSLGGAVLVIGKPGSGKSVALVGYLLFYLNALGVRVILQAEDRSGRVGFIFDDDGVREVTVHDAKSYNDGKPCFLLVSADGAVTYPSELLAFCSNTIVVTSPNLKFKHDLRNWKKQVVAEQFVAPPPSCPEVVYLLSKTGPFDSYLVYWVYREWTRDFRRCRHDCTNATSHLKNRTLFKWYEQKTEDIKSYARKMLSGTRDPSLVQQLPDDETNLTIPSDLVTMERRTGTTSRHKVVFMTRHIADIVAGVLEEGNWALSWETLDIYFRDPETRVSAGQRFQRMFLEKFRKQDPNKMPPCYELGKATGVHPLSPLKEDAAEAAMPWKGLAQQPTLEYLSVGKDTSRSLYSKRELRAVMDAAMDENPPPIRFLIPRAQNWASWDAAIVLYAKEEGRRAVHVIFLQTTVRPEHEIYSKGLNQVRDAVPPEWNHGEGPDVHYHYVLVLLTRDEAMSQIPKWRPVLLSSKDPKKDPSWHQGNLRQYVMFVPMKELFKPSL